MLEALGVEPGVELVYRALLGRPSATAAACSPRSLQRPDGRGRAGARHPRRGRPRPPLRRPAYVAAPPAVALGALITERRDGLRLAEQALATLAEEHRAAVAGPQHQRR